jgi:hypothetical protein
MHDRQTVKYQSNRLTYVRALERAGARELSIIFALFAAPYRSAAICPLDRIIAPSAEPMSRESGKAPHSSVICPSENCLEPVLLILA